VSSEQVVARPDGLLARQPELGVGVLARAVQEPVGLVDLLRTAVSSAQQAVQLAREPAGGGHGAALRVVVAAHLQVAVHLRAHAARRLAHAHLAVVASEGHVARQGHGLVGHGSARIADVDGLAVGVHCERVVGVLVVVEDHREAVLVHVVGEQVLAARLQSHALAVEADHVAAVEHVGDEREVGEPSQLVLVDDGLEAEAAQVRAD